MRPTRTHNASAQKEKRSKSHAFATFLQPMSVFFVDYFFIRNIMWLHCSHRVSYLLFSAIWMNLLQLVRGVISRLGWCVCFSATPDVCVCVYVCICACLRLTAASTAHHCSLPFTHIAITSPLEPFTSLDIPYFTLWFFSYLTHSFWWLLLCKGINYNHIATFHMHNKVSDGSHTDDGEITVKTDAQSWIMKHFQYILLLLFFQHK